MPHPNPYTTHTTHRRKYKDQFRRRFAWEVIMLCPGKWDKAFAKAGPLHLKVLYLQPNGSSVKCGLREWWKSYASVHPRRVMALWSRSERVALGEWMILEAVCEILVSFFYLVAESVLQKWVKQYNRMDWMMLFCRSNRREELKESSLSLQMTWLKIVIRTIASSCSCATSMISKQAVSCRKHDSWNAGSARSDKW